MSSETFEAVKKVLIVIALDESGSMHSNVARTMSAYNEFVDGQKIASGTQAFLSLIKFANEAKVN